MSRKKKQAPLTEDDWQRIFKLRCRSKRGETVTQDEIAFCHRGYHEDPDRYSKMTAEVFQATKPFGA